ncbi:MAG: 4Fe-4S binding protein [Thermodesulfobacteriota bacterium]|nr:4Fe-4S binding protein [Thermodesulfobacteriota bacterium]
MQKRRMTIHQGRCTGCRLCEAVCSLYHGEKMDLTLSRIQIDPSSENRFMPRVCLQCQACPPSEVCPNGAFERDEATGVVKILRESCDGCGLCAPECPFSSVFEENGGVMVCDICGGDPRCVEVCQKQALLFGPAEVR